MREISPQCLESLVTRAFGGLTEALIKVQLAFTEALLAFGTAGDAAAASLTDTPRILPRIDIPFTHLTGLFSKHSNPALSHFAQGIRDRSHSMRRRRQV